MKKTKRILSAFAAFAVAAASITLPIDNDSLFSASVSAEPTYSTEGGLTLETMDGKGPNPDPSTPDPDTFDFNTLAKGDQFKLIIEVPPLKDYLKDSNGTQLNGLDTITMVIKYDPAVFEVEKWYNVWVSGPNQSTVSGWVSAEETAEIFGGTHGWSRDDSSNGKLYLTLQTSSDDSSLKLFKDNLESTTKLEAVFSVKDSSSIQIGHDYEFSFSTDNGEELDFSFQETDVDAATTTNTNVWQPANRYAFVQIANSIEGTLNGYTFNNAKDRTTGEYKDTVTMEICTTMEYGGRIVDTGVIPECDTLDYENREFKFRGVELDKTYLIRTKDKWCKYETHDNSGNSVWVERGTDVKIDNATLSNGVTVNIRLYGDVDNNGKVEAKDATLILKYLVGMNVAEIPDNTSLGYQIANVLSGTGEEYLNARDATQILRYVIGSDSVFNYKPQR